MVLFCSFNFIYAENGNEEFIKGYEYYQKADYKNSEKMFLESIKKGNIRANYNLANLYLEKKDYKNAEKYYGEVLLKADRRDTEVLLSTIFNLAKLDLEVGEYGKAKSLLEFLFKKTPENPKVSYALGVISYYIDNNYSEAERYLKKSLEDVKNDKKLENNIKILLEQINKNK